MGQAGVGPEDEHLLCRSTIWNNSLPRQHPRGPGGPLVGSGRADRSGQMV